MQPLFNGDIAFIYYYVDLTLTYVPIVLRFRLRIQFDAMNSSLV